MNINVNDFNIYTPFGDLENGEAFYYEPSGIIWMKLLDGDFHNYAVALDDGTVCEFSDHERVVKVDIECKITISPIKRVDN